MTRAVPEREPRPPPDADAQIEALVGICRLHSAMISELAESNRELRQEAGLDPPPPMISESTPWRSIKQVAYVTGYSEPMVRELISQKRIVAEKRGGRWFIDVSKPMPRKLESAIVRAGSTPRTASGK